MSGGEKSYASEGLAGGALPIGHSATRREIGPANTRTKADARRDVSRWRSRATAVSHQCLGVDIIPNRDKAAETRSDVRDMPRCIAIATGWTCSGEIAAKTM